MKTESRKAHRADPERNGVPRPGEDERSLAALLRDLSVDGAELVRQEVALAKAEMNQKVQIFQTNLASMALGAALLMAALLTALWTVNRGLTVLLEGMLSVETAIWLSPLLLTLVLAASGWGLLSAAKRRIAAEGLTPDRTTNSIRTNKRWAEGKVRDIKEEVTRG